MTGPARAEVTEVVVCDVTRSRDPNPTCARRHVSCVRQTVFGDNLGGLMIHGIQGAGYTCTRIIQTTKSFGLNQHFVLIYSSIHLQLIFYSLTIAL